MENTTENKKDWIDGLILKAPKEGSPDFVKGKVSVKVDNFKAYLDAKNNNGWVNIDLLESREGKLYFKLNDWKPNGENTSKAEYNPDAEFDALGANLSANNLPF